MATVIRFARHGTKKKPYFRIVVQNSQSPRDGRFIEHIGAFDPQKGDQSLVVQRDRLIHWLGCGAQMSTSVKNTLKTRLREWQTGTPEATPTPAPETKAKTKSAPKEA
jgi:small subunit ribosomal protein S16